MKQITAIFRNERLDAVKDALEKINCKGITVMDVKGRGEQLGIEENYRGNSYKLIFFQKIKIVTVVPDNNVEKCNNSNYRSSKKQVMLVMEKYLLPI